MRYYPREHHEFTCSGSAGVTLRSDRIFFWSIVAGLAVRGAAAALTSNSTDLALFGYVAQQGAAGHALYSYPGFSYPPLVGYLWMAAGKLLAALHVPVLVHVGALSRSVVPGLVTDDLTTPGAAVAIKSPGLVADAALAFAVDRACRIAGAGAAARRLAVLGVWLNPIVIFDSAVQASWDAAVPASIIAAGLASVEGAGAAGGAWLALGTLTKLVPVVCAPLIGVALARSDSHGTPVARVWWAIAAAVAIVAIGTIPIAAPGDLAALRDTFSNRVDGSAFGGFNVWIALEMSALGPAASWFRLHSGAVAAVSGALELTGVFAVTAAAWLIPRLSVERWMMAALMTLAIVVLAAAYAQPGYAVWLVPFCFILGSLGHRRLLNLAVALSTSAFLFAMAVRAPATLAIPGCWFFRLCDAAAFARYGFTYAFAPGRLTSLLQLDIDLVFGVVGGALCVWIFCAAIRAWRAPRDA